MVQHLEGGNPPKPEKSNDGRSRVWGHIRRFSTAYRLLLVGLASTLVLFAVTDRLVEDHQRVLYEAAVDDTVRILDQFFAGDLNTLLCLQAVFETHKKLDADGTRAFLRTRDYEHDPSALGNVGFCIPVFSTNRATELDLFLKRGFNVYFPGINFEREVDLPIVFLNDSSQGRLRGTGWNPYASDRIRTAMGQARDSGTCIASYKIPLQSTNTAKPLEGFVVFFPLYTTVSVPATVEERRQSCVGFVFGTFPTDPLWRGMIHIWKKEHLVNVAVFEGEHLLMENLIFDLYGEATNGVPSTWSHPPRHWQVDRKTALGREWNFVLTSSEYLNRASERGFPALVLVLGCLGSLVLFGVQMRGFRRIEKLIEQLRAANEAFFAEKERLAVTLRSIGDGVIATDTNGRITLMNKTAESLTGWSQDVATGRRVDEIFKVEYLPESSETAPDRKNVLQAGEPLPLPFSGTLTQRTGARRLISEIAAPICGPDNTMAGSVLVFRDVTEQQDMEARLRHSERMESVGRLAGGIAHDFNNLLTVITGNMEIARSLVRNPAALTQCIDEVSAASQRAATLTRQLLSFSRRQIIEPQTVDLGDLVGDLQKILSRVIREDISLEIRVAENLGAVKVDIAQFEHVLINLAANARDAMPHGGKLLIEMENVDLGPEFCVQHPNLKPGRFVLLSVIDTGHGMSEEVRQHIFEPFFTTKPTGKGTGLGLAMVFGAVEQAGGVIEVLSAKCWGTSFKIYLPRIDEKAEKIGKLPVSVVPPTGTETVLLVEDEESLRRLTLRILTGLGYSVLTASGGTEAIQTLEHYDGRVDLLVTDVVMPGMNGRDLSGQLLKIQPNMKVLFVSGYSEDVIAHHGVVDQKLNFIGKPYSAMSLGEKIRQVLEKNEGVISG